MGSQARGTMTVLEWCTSCIADDFNQQSKQDISDYLSNHHDQVWTAIAICSIAGGLLTAFAGFGLFYFTLGLTGFLLGFAAFFSIACGASGSAIVAGISGVVGGLLFSYLLIRIEKIGLLLCGAA